MEGLTLIVFNWLTELEEHEAAKFIEQCIIDNVYLDTMWRLDGDIETHIYEAIIYTPLKIYKTLEQYKVHTGKIEDAIKEFGESDGVYVKEIIWRAQLPNNNPNKERSDKISEILDQDYIKRQLEVMNGSIKQNPHIALGIAKELIETSCKFILKENNITYDSNWDILRFVKETNKVINLTPFEMEKKEILKTGTAKILSGLSNIVHGITELRNAYGSGHGHEAGIKIINESYVRLAVHSAGELVLFYLTLHNTKK